METPQELVAECNELKFLVPTCSVSKGARELFQTLGKGVTGAARLFIRHFEGNWGSLDLGDKFQNELNLSRGSGTLMSIFDLEGHQVWVLTDSDWKCCTMLLPDEY